MGVAAGIRGRTGRALRWFVAVGLLLGFGWFFATRLDPAALVRALGGADYRLVLLCAVGHMVILHPLKAWRWSPMLSPMQRISPWTLYQYNLAGCAATNVLPARSGQAVRAVLVCPHGLPVTGAIAVVVLEEILNASMLALIALPLPFMLDLGRRTAVVLALVGVGAFLGLGVAVWLVRSGRAHPSGLRRRLADGLALLADPGAALRVFVQTAILWLVDLAQIALLTAAVSSAPGFTSPDPLAPPLQPELRLLQRVRRSLGSSSLRDARPAALEAAPAAHLGRLPDRWRADAPPRSRPHRLAHERARIPAPAAHHQRIPADPEADRSPERRGIDRSPDQRRRRRAQRHHGEGARSAPRKARGPRATRALPGGGERGDRQRASPGSARGGPLHAREWADPPHHPLARRFRSLEPVHGRARRIPRGQAPAGARRPRGDRKSVV